MQVATRDDGRTTRDPAYQGYQLLRAVFVVAPILFGLDKFFNWMVEWPDYLAPWLDRHRPRHRPGVHVRGRGGGDPGGAAGPGRPEMGADSSPCGSAAIIVNLLTGDPPEYYDIALRDVGLLLAALTLNRLATSFETRTVAREVGRHEPRVAA